LDKESLVNETNRDKPDRIDLNDKARCEQWVRKLNVTHEQLREAVGAVGDNASDVEMHLKGTRATTNDDKIEKSGGQDRPS
jgi:hypothetical protein